MSEFISKNGLYYSQDLHTIYGIDASSKDFTGRIPYGAHCIEEEAFSGCELEEISMPDSVNSIGASLFGNCKKLKKVKLPSQLTKLSPYLFSGCSLLEKVNMPNVVEAFTEGMFFGCASLKDIPFRAGIKELPENIFNGCSSLKSLVIPSTVERIESRAIADCKALSTLVLPANLKYIAEDAFEGSEAIHNIRFNGVNDNFYVNEEGCLCQKTADGEKIILKTADYDKPEVSFFKENVDEETDSFYSDEGLFEEEDSSFSAEVGAEEFNSDQNVVETDAFETETIENEKIEIEDDEESTMSDGIDNTLDEIMAEQHQANLPTEVSINPEELEMLFNKKEEAKEEASAQTEEEKFVDSKTKILLSSAGFSKVENCNPAGEVPEDNELFVIAEKLVEAEDGTKAVSEKLLNCSRKIARIQDFSKIVFLSELPVDNDEFMEFYYHFITQRNVLFACEAQNPSLLSDYAKKICDASRISLDKEKLFEQRKRISIKNASLIKLIIQDLYN